MSPSSEPAWIIEPIEDQTRADALGAALQSRVIAFNIETTGFRDGRTLSFAVHDATGELVAGLDGFTWGGYARVDWLWVHEARRRSGLGAALMASAEAEVRARGCETIILETHDFQAPGFYEGLGFERVGTTVGTPRGSRHFTYQKRLSRDG